MFVKFNNIEWKYFWIELSFLLFLSFGVSLISDLEYSAYEQHDISRFADEIGYRLITGSFSLITYSIYYFAFLKRYVFGREIIGIILCSAGFVVVDQLMDKFPSNWVIIHTDWVSSHLKARSVEDLLRPRIIFAFNHRIISSIIPLIGFTFLIRSLQQDEQMRALKEQQLMSELNYLKAQLHPHFFFNTMNNIYSLALNQSKDTAPVVAKLADMMRYILYEAAQPKVPIVKEIDFLRNYIQVEQIRHQQNTIKFDVQGVNETLQIEPLLMLPFIENAFKHGLEQETGKGFVDIVLCVIENELTLQVVNSKPAPINSNPGIGLQNILRRLTLLYPDKHQLDIKDEPNTYHVTLTLQLA